MNREYKTGTRWCVWRWKDVGYLKRLHLVHTPFGSICFHWIRRPDAERCLHDHPVSFLSLILRGGYTEARSVSGWPELTEARTRRWFNFFRASFNERHRIVAVEPGTLTLCFMGPNRRVWGFHTPEGWVSWKDYHVKP